MMYDHRYANPESAYRRFVHRDNVEANKEFLSHVRQLQNIRQQAQALAPRRKKSAAIIDEQDDDTSASTNPSFEDYLDPVPLTPTQDQYPTSYDRLPRLTSVTVRMMMHQSVTHSKRVLLNGMLALYLVTGQQPSIMRASHPDSKLKIRRGMPVGVECELRGDLMFGFVDKLVHVVLPRLRDFRGFCKSSNRFPPSSTIVPTPLLSRRMKEMQATFNRSTLLSFVDSLEQDIQTPLPASGGGEVVRLGLSAESWQGFPEIEAAYLKFPSTGSLGALQDYVVEFGTTARSDEDARLLLSGYRIPFTYLDPIPTVTVEENTYQQSTEEIHDV
jgi:ribosomal protein L5